VKWKKTGNGRIEMPDYPYEAVHEAIVNALVHRDYMIQGSEIHIDMYDNRLEIVSPGGMPDGKRIQDLSIADIFSIRRNPVICDIFSRLWLMERRGSGLNKIIEEYPADLILTFRSTEQSFIVTLKNVHFGDLSMPNGDDVGDDNGVDDGVDNGDENIGKILAVIKDEPTINQKNLALKTEMSERTISREIKAMREKEIISRVGSDRAGYWSVN
jgi:predicted HTH transcriptional regulator